MMLAATDFRAALSGEVYIVVNRKQGKADTVAVKWPAKEMAAAHQMTSGLRHVVLGLTPIGSLLQTTVHPQALYGAFMCAANVAPDRKQA